MTEKNEYDLLPPSAATVGDDILRDFGTKLARKATQLARDRGTTTVTDIDIKNAYSELVPTVNPHWFIRAACHAMEIIGAIVVPIGITADGPGVKYAWLASAMGAALVVIAIFIRESRIR